MPGVATATALTFDASEIALKFGEQYVSAGLNAKTATSVNKGIYRGFGLDINGANRTVTIKADSVESDHVAVYETATGYSLTIRKTGGDFSYALTAFANTTVAIAIHAVYEAVSTVPTAAYIKVYEVSPVDNFTTATEYGELIVLGTVAVPSSAIPLVDSNITYTGRNNAWEATPPGNVFSDQIIRNHSFNRALTVTNPTAKFAAFYWELGTVSGLSTYVGSGVGASGSNAFECEVTNTVGAKTGNILLQRVGIPAFSDCHLRVKLSIKCLKAAASGSLNCSAVWRQNDGDTVTPSTSTKSITITSVDGSYRTVDFTLRADDLDTTYVLLDNISFDLSSADYSSAGTGVAFIIDSVQAWLEQETVLNSQKTSDRQRAPLNGSSLILEDTGSVFDDDGASTLISYTPSNIVISRVDQSTTLTQPNLEVKGSETLGANLLSNETDARTARLNTKYSITAGVDFTLIWESAPDSGSHAHTRLYVGGPGSESAGDGSLVFTTNAIWGGATWTKDLNGANASLIEQSKDHLTFKQQVNDAAWTTWDETIATFNTVNGSTNVLSNATDTGKDVDNLIPYNVGRFISASRRSGVAARTLHYEQYAEETGASLRHYLTYDGQMEITYNCYWDESGAKWTRDIAGNCTKLLFNDTKLKTFLKTSATSGTPWDDSSWTSTNGMTFDFSTNTITNIDGIYKITGATTASTGSNPANTVALTNELRAKNICKCWGKVTISGGVATVNDGINFTASIVSDNLRITFASGMANANYAVVANVMNTVRIVQPLNATTAHVDLGVYDAAAVQITLSSAPAVVMFQIFATQ